MPLTNEQIIDAVMGGIKDEMSAIHDTVEEQSNSRESQSSLSDEYHPEKE